MKTEQITHAQWESQAKRIEKANLKAFGKSTSFVGIASRARHMIVDVRTDSMIVKTGWREAMKEDPA